MTNDWTAKVNGMEQETSSHWIANENIARRNLQLEDKAKLYEIKQCVSLACVSLWRLNGKEKYILISMTPQTKRTNDFKQLKKSQGARNGKNHVELEVKLGLKTKE